MTQTQLAAAGLLVAATATTGGLAYAALSAQSQIFGSVLVSGADSNQIALTYDDGPNDVATERLLEILARYEVRATFFLIGRFVQQRPQIARAIAAAGHTVGNHTMTHPWLAWQSAARIGQELSHCNAALEDALGLPIRFFRAPHGARRPVVLRIARELGLTPVQWNTILGDWKPITAREIADRALRGIAHNQQRQRASNILLHDGGHQSIGQPRLPTVEATALILQQLQTQPEIRFVTVDAWTYTGTPDL